MTAAEQARLLRWVVNLYRDGLPITDGHGILLRSEIDQRIEAFLACATALEENSKLKEALLRVADLTSHVGLGVHGHSFAFGSNAHFEELCRVAEQALAPAEDGGA